MSKKYLKMTCTTDVNGNRFHFDVTCNEINYVKLLWIISQIGVCLNIFQTFAVKKSVVSNHTWSLPNFSNQMIVYKRIGIKTIPRELHIIATILMGLLVSKNEKKSSWLSIIAIILLMKKSKKKIQSVSLIWASSIRWLWIDLRLEPIYTTAMAASENDAQYKSDQNWLKNNYLALFI